MCAISACVIAGMSDNFLFHALDSISFSVFCLHGAKAKDKTPRFGTLRKWRHPQCESGLIFPLAFIHSHSGATGVFRNAFMGKVAEATSCLPKTLQTT